VGKASVPNSKQVCAQVEHVGWEGLCHNFRGPAFSAEILRRVPSMFMVTEAPRFWVMNTRKGALVHFSAYLDTMP
jgi:hypothetical protein